MLELTSECRPKIGPVALGGFSGSSNYYPHQSPITGYEPKITISAMAEENRNFPSSYEEVSRFWQQQEQLRQREVANARLEFGTTPFSQHQNLSLGANYASGDTRLETLQGQQSIDVSVKASSHARTPVSENQFSLQHHSFVGPQLPANVSNAGGDSRYGTDGVNLGPAFGRTPSFVGHQLPTNVSDAGGDSRYGTENPGPSSSEIIERRSFEYLRDGASFQSRTAPYPTIIENLRSQNVSLDRSVHANKTLAESYESEVQRWKAEAQRHESHVLQKKDELHKMLCEFEQSQFALHQQKSTFEQALHNRELKFHSTCIDYEHTARQACRSEILHSEQFMDVRFKDQLGMLHRAFESNEHSEREKLMDEARQALQNQKVQLEAAASERMHSEHLLQEERVQNVKLHLKHLHEHSLFEQSSAYMSEKRLETENTSLESTLASLRADFQQMVLDSQARFASMKSEFLVEMQKQQSHYQAEICALQVEKQQLQCELRAGIAVGTPDAHMQHFDIGESDRPGV